MALNLKAASEQILAQRRTVGFDSYDITAKQLTDMISEGQINVSPEYQRHFIWDEVRQSQLVESLYLGIPVPSLFMATNKDATWEVIDGLQRLTTLMNFIFPKQTKSTLSLKELRLSGLEKLTELNGATFSDLPSSMRLQLLTRPVRITVLNDLSDYKVRFDLFERLNTGGIVLHEQEIRNCVYIGRFNDFIRDCAKDDRLRILVKRNDQAGKGNLEELTLKVFAYLENRDEFVHSVKDFLNNYMEQKTKKFTNEPRLRHTWDQTMAALVAALPNGVARPDRPNTTPLLLFEALAVGVASVFHANQKVDPSKISSVITNAELQKTTTGATNSRPKLKARINTVADAVRV